MERESLEGVDLKEIVRGMTLCQKNATDLFEEADILLSANKFPRAYALFQLAGEELNYKILDKSYTDGQIKVIQPDGRTVLQLSTQTGIENRINVSQWASGVYQLVYFRANGTIIQQRFGVR